MIKIRIKRNAGKVARVTVSGHAGSAPKGEDLICAAVSALAQSYLFSLQRLLKIQVGTDVTEGYLSLTLPTNLPERTADDATLLAESMLIGMDEINRSYPGFLEVTDE
jgi:hypothetical protein